MERSTAEKVIADLNSCIGEMLETLPIVEREASETEYKIYKRRIAKIVSMFDMEVVEFVAADHPELKPWERKSDEQ